MGEANTTPQKYTKVKKMGSSIFIFIFIFIFISKRKKE